MKALVYINLSSIDYSEINHYETYKLIIVAHHSLRIIDKSHLISNHND